MAALLSRQSRCHAADTAPPPLTGPPPSFTGLSRRPRRQARPTARHRAPSAGWKDSLHAAPQRSLVATVRKALPPLPGGIGGTRSPARAREAALGPGQAGPGGPGEALAAAGLCRGSLQPQRHRAPRGSGGAGLGSSAPGKGRERRRGQPRSPGGRMEPEPLGQRRSPEPQHPPSRPAELRPCCDSAPCRRESSTGHAPPLPRTPRLRYPQSCSAPPPCPPLPPSRAFAIPLVPAVPAVVVPAPGFAILTAPSLNSRLYEPAHQRHRGPTPFPPPSPPLSPPPLPLSSAASPAPQSPSPPLPTQRRRCWPRSRRCCVLAVPCGSRICGAEHAWRGRAGVLSAPCGRCRGKPPYPVFKRTQRTPSCPRLRAGQTPTLNPPLPAFGRNPPVPARHRLRRDRGPRPAEPPRAGARGVRTGGCSPPAGLPPLLPSPSRGSQASKTIPRSPSSSRERSAQDFGGGGARRFSGCRPALQGLL
ncbi:uncharacterized protein LOC118695371 [Molothrus ater]|uniref:uncharacterized protein LOC118695371 n=1 Tax=Molothrus ater TaxID=84834 RepID=UPI00174B0619|nr:uncharacterized protein LOC118695371 [Molothrus ater]